MKETKEVVVYSCGYCGKLYRNKEDADFCHADRTCSNCGTVIGKDDYYVDCKCCRDKKKKEKKLELFKKATKLSFSEYDGYFLYSSDEIIDGKDTVGDELYYRLKNGETVPSWLWALKKMKVFDLDIYDIINEKTEDGYYEMIEHLDMDDTILSDIQNELDTWVANQGDSIYSYEEDTTIAVVLDDLIEEIKLQIANEG